jgi:hypothetical protein
MVLTSRSRQKVQKKSGAVSQRAAVAAKGAAGRGCGGCGVEMAIRAWENLFV